MTNNAEVIVDVLEKAGIRYVFGIPSGQNVRFVDALRGSGIEFVLVTHEGCAGFMADVVGRLTGKPGVCLSTLGPGATNMTTGVGNAFLDRVPVLAFTAQMGRFWRGRTVQMHIDHQKLYAPITKWSTWLETGKIVATMKRAMEIALQEQPGPVHLDLPEDVAEEFSQESPEPFEIVPPVMPSFDAGALAKAVGLIQKAQYPLVALGLTMNRCTATSELRAFVGKHELPTVCTLMAKGHAAEEGSHFVGVLGRARRDIVAEYIKPADLIIAIGYDPIEFNYEEWVQKDIPLIHIDTVPADIHRDYNVPCQVVGNIRDILKALGRIPKLAHRWNLRTLEQHREKLFTALTPKQDTFSPHQVLLAMRDLLPPNGLLVDDVGAHTHLVGQLWDTRGPGNFLVSNGWSSMGFAIPGAIAAKLVQRDRPVVACVGDGAFLMTVGEISTAVRLRLPVVFVVLRDNALSLIKIRQVRRHLPPHGIQLLNAHYRSSNTFFGARVIPVHHEEAFREAFQEGLEGDEPLIIEAIVDPSEYEALI